MHKPIVFAVLALALAGCAKHQTAPEAAAAQNSGVNLVYVDKTVAPGDDFDAYANGAWRKTAVIPPDRGSTGVFYDVSLKNEARGKELIEALIKANPAAGTDERRIVDDFTGFMDMDGIEKRGLGAAKPMLDQFAAIADKKALAEALGEGVRADTDPINATNFYTDNLFGVFVAQTVDDPTRYKPYLLQGGLGLPDRDYFLSKDKEMAKIRDAYRIYIADMLALMGRPDAKAAADRIYALEEKIARSHASLLDSNDIHKSNNPWAAADFAKKAPGMDWEAFFRGAELSGQPTIIVWQPSAVIGISKLVASEPLEVWKDWLAFHLVSREAASLPKAFDDRNFAFYGQILNGTPQQQPRERRAIATVNVDLGDAVGKIYVHRYFPAQAKAGVQEMVKNILAAFDARVAGLDWMAPSTKAEARRKIQTLVVGVGYPETWRDYSRLEIRPDDPLGNSVRASKAEYRHQLGKLAKPVDRGEWWMTPQTINAVNLPLQNALNFPAAYMQPPLYDPNADAAARYGSMGATIGHEISHSFDSLGSEFDADGRMRNWWTPADLAHFKAAGQALVKQYDAYEVLPGVHVKGAQTLGENIADVAGLSAALDAYHASLAGKPAPVIDGLTGDQRFFLAYAQSWREKEREALLRQRITTDVHAPAPQRAMTVRNLDAWYPAFDVKPGQKLYLDPKDRVRIW